MNIFDDAKRTSPETCTIKNFRPKPNNPFNSALSNKNNDGLRYLYFANVSGKAST